MLHNLPVAELCFLLVNQSEGKKRKIDREHRTFNSEWTNKDSVPSLLRGSSFAASVHRGIFFKKTFFDWLRITSLIVCA